VAHLPRIAAAVGHRWALLHRGKVVPAADAEVVSRCWCRRPRLERSRIPIVRRPQSFRGGVANGKGRSGIAAAAFGLCEADAYYFRGDTRSGRPSFQLTRSDNVSTVGSTNCTGSTGMPPGAKPTTVLSPKS